MLVKPLKEAPAGDMLVCAKRPAGFGPESWALIPPEVRDTLIEWAEAMGANASLLDRNVNWHVPGRCASHPPDS